MKMIHTVMSKPTECQFYLGRKLQYSLRQYLDRDWKSPTENALRISQIIIIQQIITLIP